MVAELNHATCCALHTVNGMHTHLWYMVHITAPQHLVCRVVPSLHINHMQMSIIEVFICRRLHMNTSMILICIWLICRLGTTLHTKCCGAVSCRYQWWQLAHAQLQLVHPLVQLLVCLSLLPLWCPSLWGCWWLVYVLGYISIRSKESSYKPRSRIAPATPYNEVGTNKKMKGDAMEINTIRLISEMGGGGGGGGGYQNLYFYAPLPSPWKHARHCI